MTTPIQHSPTPVETSFSDEETRALEAVRVRFGQDHDVLSAQERERLRFVRWLIQTGRLIV
jgi:hypothetical protein